MQLEPKTSYNNDNLAVYEYTLSQDETEQLKRLTDDEHRITVSQVNVSYINSFDDTWTMRLSGQSIDFDLTYTDENQQQQSFTEKNFVAPTFNEIPLQCQTANQLLNYLNYPYFHYTVNLNGDEYEADLVSGKVVWWGTYNGKIQFNTSEDGYIILTKQSDQSVIYKTDSVAFHYPDGGIAYNITNFYYANQILGITNDIVNIMNKIGVSQALEYIPYNGYTLSVPYNAFSPVQIGQEYYYPIKQFSIQLVFDLKKSVTFQLPYFLQIWRELYVLTDLQTQDMIYKEGNINFNNSNHLVTYDQYEIDGTTPRTNIYSNIYKSFAQMPCICYYVNSISFNNYCSIKNTYQLQFMRQEQYYSLESLKNSHWYLVDEHGMILPNLLSMKIYIQYQGIQEEEQKINTTGMQRVIAQIDNN